MRAQLIFFVAALLCGACAHAPDLEPVRVRPGQPNNYSDAELRDRAIIVEFHEGDVIPFDFTLEGDLVSAPATSVPMTVKRPFFLLIDPKKGLKTSLDGRSFDQKPRAPGTFRLGMSVTREKGAHAELHIETPAH